MSNLDEAPGRDADHDQNVPEGSSPHTSTPPDGQPATPAGDAGSEAEGQSEEVSPVAPAGLHPTFSHLSREELEAAINAIADSEWKQVHPSWVRLQQIGGAISFLVLGVPTLIGAALLVYFEVLPELWRWVPALVWLIFGGWLLFMAAIYPSLAYRRIRYMVSPLGMEIRRGVIWRHIINVPRSRVQHTDVAQGPLQRRYGVGTLVTHTAGTQNHTVELGGLPHPDAMLIRDYLIRGGESGGL